VLKLSFLQNFCWHFFLLFFGSCGRRVGHGWTTQCLASRSRTRSWRKFSSNRSRYGGCIRITFSTGSQTGGNHDILSWLVALVIWLRKSHDLAVCLFPVMTCASVLHSRLVFKHLTDIYAVSFTLRSPREGCVWVSYSPHALACHVTRGN